MDDEAHNDCEHVHPQLLGHHLQVINWNDLATDQTRNPHRRIPTTGEMLHTTVLHATSTTLNCFSTVSLADVINCNIKLTTCTDHIIMPTSLMTISLRMLKKSIISLAFSPIFPMQIPKATKKPMIPRTRKHSVHIETLKRSEDLWLRLLTDLKYKYIHSTNVVHTTQTSDILKSDHNAVFLI